MLARCPNCRNTFSTDHAGRQDCPVCKKPLLVPEPEAPPKAEILTEAQGTPWERRLDLGLWTAWWQTVQQALLEPGKLFGSARLDRGTSQLGFAMLTASVFSVIGQLFGAVLSRGQEAMMQRWLDQFPADSPFMPGLKALVEMQRNRGVFSFLLAALFTPLVSLVFIYLNAAVTHAAALLFGQAKRGFPATFAACAYVCAPLVLCAVPACGGVIAVVWLVVLTGIGMKVTHGISAGGAAASTLGPYLACCCLGFALSIAFGAMMARQLP